MAFTTFNIVLDDGTETLPGTAPWSEHPWCIATQRCLRALFPQGFAGLRIVDLACLEGGYAAAFARMGFGEVLGIEVRKVNYLNCMRVKQGVDLPNLKFVNDDVWNLERYGMFDVVFCSGILYHLDMPKQFIELMAKVAKRAVLINTHFATKEPLPGYELSEMTESEGLPGRWYPEPAPNSEAVRWAAWDNDWSFWIQREYLIQTIRDAGFSLVFEQFDLLGPDIAGSMTGGDYRAHNRGMFVGVKIP